VVSKTRTPPETGTNGIKVASIPNLYGKLEDMVHGTWRWDNIFLALNTKGAGIDLRGFLAFQLELETSTLNEVYM
jgi:hypothetical protein